MDWLISCGIATTLMLAFPLVGKFIVEPYCQFCNKVMFGKKQRYDR